MTFQPWLDRLKHELRKRVLPSGYSTRLIEELTEHFKDVQMENPSMDAQKTIDEAMGSPEVVARNAQKGFLGRTFVSRYRLRKRFSILTLVTALLFVGGWVRSRSVADTVMFPVKSHTFDCFVSATGSLVWQRTHVLPQPGGLDEVCTIGPIQTTWMRQSISTDGANDDPGFIWKWRLCGFGFASTPPEQTEQMGMSATFLYIPYWSIIFSMIVVSFVLFLRKPHKSNQERYIEPVPTVGI